MKTEKREQMSPSPFLGIQYVPKKSTTLFLPESFSYYIVIIIIIATVGPASYTLLVVPTIFFKMRSQLFFQ